MTRESLMKRIRHSLWWMVRRMAAYTESHVHNMRMNQSPSLRSSFQHLEESKRYYRIAKYCAWRSRMALVKHT